MQGNFSAPSLQALLDTDIDVCAVVIPVSPIPGLKQPAIQRREQPRGIRTALPLLSLHPSIVQIAWQRHIPVWEVRSLTDAITYSTLAAYEPDGICVACFSQRIPRAILELPQLGCLNVHPSLLPANRGPVPLFWTFRNGDETTGVTIHFLEETMDTGDILAQEHIEVPDGISYEQLEMRCAIKGGTLLANAVHNLYKNNITHTSQDEAKSSYYSFPTNEDFVIRAGEWDARHIFNFINGVGHWDSPIEIRSAHQTFFTRQCTSYSQWNTNKPLENPENSATFNQEIKLSCRDGWVKIRLLEKQIVCCSKGVMN
ncbi:MAG: hypothetical protein NVS4B12_07020 [Ktedonobacteraceae bacterium]